MFDKFRRAAERVVKAFGNANTPTRVQVNEAMLAASAGVRAPKKKKRVSKYMPHQGPREMARRVRQRDGNWMDV